MKINTLSIQQDNQFKQDLDYEEWLRDNNPEPTIDEINNMDRVFCKLLYLKNHL